MWITAIQSVIILELPVPCEGGIPAANKLKRPKYLELATERRETGWAASIHPVEVSGSNFAGRSVIQLLGAARTTGTFLQKAIKNLGEESERASYPQLRGRDSTWSQTPH